jgi:hypothetical protein
LFGGCLRFELAGLEELHDRAKTSPFRQELQCHARFNNIRASCNDCYINTSGEWWKWPRFGPALAIPSISKNSPGKGHTALGRECDRVSRGKEAMRTAILIAMAIVALSSNPFIHKDQTAEKNAAAQPISTPESVSKARRTLQTVRLKSALRGPSIVVRLQTFGN